MIDNRFENQTYILITHKVIKGVNYITFEIKNLFEPAFIPQKAICIPFDIPSIVSNIFSNKGTSSTLTLKEVLRGVKEVLTQIKISYGETVIHNKNVFPKYLKQLLELFGITEFECKGNNPCLILEDRYFRYIHWEVIRREDGFRSLVVLFNNSIYIEIFIDDYLIELKYEGGYLVFKEKDKRTNKIITTSFSASEFFKRFIRGE